MLSSERARAFNATAGMPAKKGFTEICFTEAECCTDAMASVMRALTSIDSTLRTIFPDVILLWRGEHACGLEQSNPSRSFDFLKLARFNHICDTQDGACPPRMTPPFVGLAAMESPNNAPRRVPSPFNPLPL